MSTPDPLIYRLELLGMAALSLWGLRLGIANRHWVTILTCAWILLGCISMVYTGKIRF